MRAQVSFERDDHAKERDEVAQKRDRIAEERDRAAEEHDREMMRLAEEAGHGDPRATQALQALAEMRDKAAAYRTQAAADRQRAARDRLAAAEDRHELLSELERAHLDDLTGTYRRGSANHTRTRRNQDALPIVRIHRSRHEGVHRPGEGPVEPIQQDRLNHRAFQEAKTLPPGWIFVAGDR